MSISAAAKARQASERYMLVRMRPARLVNDSLVSGGGLWSMTFPYPIAAIKRNDSILTAVTTTPSVNDTYRYNETTGQLDLKLGGAPSTTNNIVVYYYIFLTGHRSRQVNETPGNTSTPLRDWEPRIISYPTIKESFKNILAGVFTIESSTLEVINTDNVFQNYLGVNDSFNQKDVDIWMAVDSTSDMTKVFQGRVNSLRISRGKVLFSFYDSLAYLNQSAYFGDTDGEAYFSRRSGSFPNLDPNFQYKPVPLILSRFSPYKTLAEPGFFAGLRLDPNNCYQAVCTSYDTDIQTSKNRTWGVGRVTSGGFRQPVLPVLKDVSSSGNFTNLIMYKTDYDAGADVEIGDMVRLVEGATTVYGRVVRIIPNVATVPATSEVMLTTTAVGTPAFTASVTMTWSSAPSIVIRAGVDDFYPHPIRDYTANVVATTGGNYYVSVTFVNNFEANFPALVTLDPAKHAIHYRVGAVATDLNHSTVLRKLCQSAGLTIDTTSFNAAVTALNVRTAFTVPMLGETAYGTYRDYAEQLLKSTLGYVRLNDSQQVEYKLFAAPGASDPVDNNTILTGSLDVEIDYNDVYSDIVASNPHYDNITSIDATLAAATVASSSKARYLHDVIKTNRFEHVLESITGRIAAILALKATRQTRYRFDTATTHLDTVLGSDVRLQTEDVLGGGDYVDLKIVGLSRRPDKTTVEATDLKDL